MSILQRGNFVSSRSLGNIRHGVSGLLLNRGFHSSFARDEPRARLEYDHYEPTERVAGGSSTPLLILHGLFGSKKNWKTLAKRYVSGLNTDVYALDLRNHGESPHMVPLNYDALARDVSEFLKTKGLSKVNVIGHSMGGKVAMTLGLNEPGQLEKLIVADMSPVAAKLSNDFDYYISCMKKIEEAKHTKQSAADADLEQYIPDAGIRLFLMTNLKRDSDGIYRWRVPLDIIKNHLEDLGDFPVAVGSKKLEKPTLFVAGSRSDYIKKDYHPTIKNFFPNVEFSELDTGHWVHAEKPKEFLDLTINFLKQ
ncbi:alpha/beta-hydrolase [Basidiobolus meristosporus CBS 931.73]|uniref:Alpha/beta-hydrolase n=1 Tax=Basidiobolus meristosporus CBS 931.73 TaxID=1314790 RepID=A0A1Y1YJT4_9FUNG|nr:alpha/beta-hydrolase [Basidiobolus meristosporus CBS 931.73]|eukprot:ORX98238.1 alpha/beta-hydrolase [Basidiobolus meristosporus CBS 931.73]